MDNLCSDFLRLPLNDCRPTFRLNIEAPRTPTRTLALDLILEILDYCSPFDLLQVRSVCKQLCAILDRRPSFWRGAYYRLHNAPYIPPIRPSKFTIYAYTYLLFSLRPCSFCYDLTNFPPVSIPLNLNSCSRNCDFQVFQGKSIAKVGDPTCPISGINLHLPTHSHGGNMYQRIPDILAAIHERNAVQKTWRPEDELVALKIRWERKHKTHIIVTEIGKDVQRWRSSYLAARHAQKKKNISLIKRISAQERIAFSTLLEAPTLRNIILAFNRDLANLTEQVWITIRGQVHQELRQRRASEMALNEKKPCFICKLSVKGMTDHIATIHKGTMIHWNGQSMCSLCPIESRRIYTRHGLKQHEQDKHTHLYDDANSLVSDLLLL
ncbi:hypothetical protein BDZ94DRAFT_1318898 [Collybia nuda]|uniref:F-box domain-containing protein n=1 Tax=Collybia nuda TaxID=64659 RepID=A0A9P6CM91_9AGAR|nr:hypothetical protein BDZ94DRAFT_1318898 [Collybia nuda]